MVRHSLLDSSDADDMLTWEHSGGFSLDAVLIPDWDRADLQRLLRYCARPPITSHSIHLLEDNAITYHLLHKNCHRKTPTQADLTKHLL